MQSAELDVLLDKARRQGLNVDRLILDAERLYREAPADDVLVDGRTRPTSIALTIAVLKRALASRSRSLTLVKG